MFIIDVSCFIASALGMPNGEPESRYSPAGPPENISAEECS